jgi:predicted PurR-regulated permease PerM
MSDWQPPRTLDAAAGYSWRLMAIAGAVVVGFFAFSLFSPVLVPLVLGLVLTAVIEPLSTRLRGRGWNASAAAGVCLLVVLAAVALLIWLVFEAIVGPWDQLSNQIVDGLDRLIAEIRNRIDDDAPGLDSVRDAFGSFAGFAFRGVLMVVGIAVALVATTFLSLLVMFYFLKDGPSIWQWVLGHAAQRADVTDEAGRAMWDRLRDFMRGTAMVAAVDGLGIGLGAVVLGVPSAAAIGLITFALAFIPFFGAFFAGFLACLIALADGGLSTALWMAAVVLLVQQVECNLLQPLLLGKSVSLHPLVVALGVIAGGVVAGILGMFLSIPVIAAGAAAVNVIRRRNGSPATGPGSPPASPPPPPDTAAPAVSR